MVLAAGFIGALWPMHTAAATPLVRRGGSTITVEAHRYRLRMAADTLDMSLDIRDPDGAWLPVTKSSAGLSYGVIRGSELAMSNGLRATCGISTVGTRVAIGRQAVLDPVRKVILELRLVCADEGILIGAQARCSDGKLQGMLWSPPRLTLEPGQWAGYAFYGPDRQRHEGRIDALGAPPSYAGISPWGSQGDTVPGFDPRHPALLVTPSQGQTGLAVVLVNSDRAWRGGSCFLQRHFGQLYLYGGYTDAARAGPRWAWLAPCDAASFAGTAERLMESGAALSATTVAMPPLPDSWTKPLPDFPTALRRKTLLRDINQAAVFTVDEGSPGSSYLDEVNRKVGSDALVRAWFKWAEAPRFAEFRRQPQAAHRVGGLFGGGITCSALYDTENGITREQLLDMATRGPDGNLVDAWSTPGIRHGSLSSPAYLDYLFRWCKEQIDAGVDYLFMDENTAALSDKEGFDDHSLADFRSYLLKTCPRTRRWAPNDARWHTELGIALDDPAICPSGGMDTFEYRAHLRAAGAVENPNAESNRLAGLFAEFRAYRDDRAWKALTDRIRAYARSLNRTVLISANGIAPYVDLQVLGVWDRWTTDNGHVDLRRNLLPSWRDLVTRGEAVAGRRVPVVLFHDWGFGDTPFPWMAVPPSEREVWMRTRGAEIYAAGAFFAFPVLGPFGCDAGRDGTLPLIAHLTEFYQRHRNIYLRARWLGCERVQTAVPLLSVSASWLPDRQSLAIHVVNRDVRAGVLTPRGPVRIRMPVSGTPVSVAIVSPDSPGNRSGAFRTSGRDLEVSLPSLEAYSVILVRYAREPDLKRLRDPVRVRPEPRWARPARSEFTVMPDGSVQNAADLVSFLQGMLHREMRDPPTFLVNAPRGATLQAHVRAVATLGARLQFAIDGRVVKTIDLPDRDGKNDGTAPEYDRTYSCSVPSGHHRVTVDNVGGDWAVVDEYRFVGTIARW